jgi:hypothetical protein
MALAPPVRCCREVIDVEEMAPSETVADTKAGRCDCLLVAGQECTEESVASGAQHTVDVVDELLLSLLCGSQGAHRPVREVCLTGVQLADFDRVGWHRAHRLIDRSPRV